MNALQINEHLIQLVKNERKITGKILQNISLFQKCSGFVKLGYPSMMSYLTRHLGYSDDQAYRRLKATQKILSEGLGLPPKENDRTLPQSNGTVWIEAQLTHEQHEKFRKIKSLLSHQCPDQKIGDLLEILCDFYLSKKSPERVTKPCPKRDVEEQKTQDSKTAQCFMETKKPSVKKPDPTCSRYISVEIKRSVWERSSGRCEYI